MKTSLLNNNQNYINRWVVSYADFVTMLLALFMVMYALSQLDIKHMKTFSNSIDRAFDGNSKQTNKSTTNLDEKSKLLKLFKTTETSVYIDNNTPITLDKSSKELKKQLSSFENQISVESANFENIRKTIKNELNNTQNINVIREPRGILIRLNDTVLFDKGSDIIKDKALNVLDKIAVVLKKEPNSIRIEGHTDNLPIKTDKFPSNWELSTARATNIIKYLVEVQKLSPNRISAAGYGEYMPVSGNDTEIGRGENRRVDIVVLSSSSKIFEPVNNRNAQDKK
ncbi:MAG TPA: flagellar motor protein MotB [Cyanobacteria bacterium UBA9971]|nr:flagellar motor protein MotB [Cyanobacteria bacterium UBA9971]